MEWLFAGAGRMAGAMIQGLLARGTDPRTLCAADPDAAARSRTAELIGDANVFEQVSAMVAARTGGLVLAVKPQQMDPVLEILRGRTFPVVVSIAAGVPTARIEAALGAATPVVRAMPNTPALVGKGVTAAAPGRYASGNSLQLAHGLLEAIGDVLDLPEDQIDAVTAISGSGPAYFFLFMQALHEAGIALGLDPDTALSLVLGTAEGAAALARHQGGDFGPMIAAVTSKGGTTERALAVLRGHDLAAMVGEAARAARDRARELAG